MTHLSNRWHAIWYGKIQLFAIACRETKLMCSSLPVVLNEYVFLMLVEENSEVLECLTQDSLCLHHLLHPSENVPAGNEHSARAHTTAFQWKTGNGTSVEPAQNIVSYSNNIWMNVRETEWKHVEWMCNLFVRRQPSHQHTLIIFWYKQKNFMLFCSVLIMEYHTKYNQYLRLHHSLVKIAPSP
jgi:hypothetical protein